MLTYTTTILDDPQGDGRGTAAFGINNLGEVVGYYLSGVNDPDHGFTYNSGSYTSVDGPGFDSIAEDVNDAGEVVGYCTYTTGVGNFNFGFVGSNQLSAPNSIETIPTGINNTGEIVGSYMDSGGRHHGFIYNGGFITLDDPNAVDTYAAKVNDSGQIVGAYYSGGQPFGFLYSGGTFTTLGFFPAGINDSEEMVGYSGGNGGNYLLVLRRSCNKYLYT